MGLRHRALNMLVFVALFAIAQTVMPSILDFKEENLIRTVGVFVGMFIASWVLTKILLHKG